MLKHNFISDKKFYINLLFCKSFFLSFGFIYFLPYKAKIRKKDVFNIDRKYY